MSRLLGYKDSLNGHKGQIWKLSWNPKPFNGAEHMLASAGEDTLIVWSCTKSRWTSNDLKSKEHLRSCAWHPDGLVLAGGDWNDVTLWLYDEAKEEFSIMKEIHHLNNEEIMSLSWSESGKLLLVCTNKGHISIIKEDMGAYEVSIRMSIGENQPVSCAMWTPWSDKFAVAAFNSIQIYEVKDGNEGVEIHEAASINSNKNKNYHKRGGAINGISFGTQNEIIVSAGDDFCLKFWWPESKGQVDLNTKNAAISKETWQCKGSLNKHSAGITCTDWSRRSNFIASACRGRTICVYEAHEDVYVLSAKRNKAHKGPIHDIKWCYEEPNMLASAGGDMVVNIWTLSEPRPGSSTCPKCPKYGAVYQRKKKKGD